MAGYSILYLHGTDQLFVQFVNLFHHLFDIKVGADEGLAALAELGAEFRVAGEEEDSFGGGVLVALLDEESGLAVEADFIRAVEVVGDDRFSSGQSLWQCARQSFTGGEVREAVHDADVARDFIRRDESGEGDVLREVEFADAGFDVRSE